MSTTETPTTVDSLPGITNPAYWGQTVTTNTQNEHITGKYTPPEDLEPGDDIYLGYGERHPNGGFRYRPYEQALTGRVIDNTGTELYVRLDFQNTVACIKLDTDKLTLSYAESEYGVKHVVRRTDTSVRRSKNASAVRVLRSWEMDVEYQDGMTRTFPVRVRIESMDDYRRVRGLVQETGAALRMTWYAEETDFEGEDGLKSATDVEQYESVVAQIDYTD